LRRTPRRVNTFLAHNDLVTLQRLEGIDAGTYLREQRARLRATAAWTSPVRPPTARRGALMGFHNNYVFAGCGSPTGSTGASWSGWASVRSCRCGISPAVMATSRFATTSTRVSTRFYSDDDW
jgi:hypothetical protein